MNNGSNGIDIADRLMDAVRTTQEHLRSVEIWACAMTAFSEPIPDYRPDDSNLLPRAYRSGANGINGHSNGGPATVPLNGFRQDDAG